MFQVCTEGRLILECTFDDLSRIKSWHFAVRSHRELVPRSVFSMHTQQDPSVLDQLSKNITRQGITLSTLHYLRVSFCSVEEIYIQLNKGLCYETIQ
jgi:LIM-domain binding protein.